MAHFEIEDPRPVNAEAPYTYVLPTAQRLAAIEVGDPVRLRFNKLPIEGERVSDTLWVVVETIDGDQVSGTVAGKSRNIPSLNQGEKLTFAKHNILDVDWRDEAKIAANPPPREYWERCIVDKCVLTDGVPVGFVYRDPNLRTKEGDRDPDSGWRIRGDTRGIDAAELRERKLSNVALGVVLNRDDSWVHLLDEEPGSAFERDFEAGVYKKVERKA